MKQVLFGTLLLCAALAGCNSDAELAGNGIGTPTNPAEVEESPTAFNIANQCVAIQSLANDRFISMNSDGSYGVSQATAVNASPFYLKPTALGKYMIYNRDEAMMRAAGNTAGTPVNSSEFLTSVPEMMHPPDTSDDTALPVGDKPAEFAEFIAALRHLPLDQGFREGFAYDNILYTVAGEVIARVSGKSWAEFVETRLFAPLGMTSCSTSSAPACRRPPSSSTCSARSTSPS